MTLRSLTENQISLQTLKKLCNDGMQTTMCTISVKASHRVITVWNRALLDVKGKKKDQ